MTPLPFLNGVFLSRRTPTLHAGATCPTALLTDIGVLRRIRMAEWAVGNRCVTRSHGAPTTKVDTVRDWLKVSGIATAAVHARASSTSAIGVVAGMVEVAVRWLLTVSQDVCQHMSQEVLLLERHLPVAVGLEGAEERPALVRCADPHPGPERFYGRPLHSTHSLSHDDDDGWAVIKRVLSDGRIT